MPTRLPTLRGLEAVSYCQMRGRLQRSMQQYQRSLGVHVSPWCPGASLKQVADSSRESTGEHIPIQTRRAHSIDISRPRTQRMPLRAYGSDDRRRVCRPPSPLANGSGSVLGEKLRLNLLRVLFR